MNYFYKIERNELCHTLQQSRTIADSTEFDSDSYAAGNKNFVRTGGRIYYSNVISPRLFTRMLHSYCNDKYYSTRCTWLERERGYALAHLKAIEQYLTKL